MKILPEGEQSAATMKAPKAETMAAIGAWSATLLASLFNLLNYNDYPMLTPEVGLVIAVLIVLAVGVGFLHNLAPRVSFAFTGGLVAVGFGLNGASETLALLLGLGALVLAWFFNRATLKIVTVVFATVALFQLGGGLTASKGPESIQEPVTGRSDLPPIVHVILDAHLGTEGMAADPALAGLRKDTIAFYSRHGFRLYDGAYSRHARTANSIPYALSFGNAPLATTRQNVQKILPPRLDYFTLLKQRGYTISSLHPDFIDFCATQPIDLCRTFRRSDLSAAAHFSLSTFDRAKLIGLMLANVGRLPNSLYERWRWLVSKITGEQPQTIFEQARLFSQASAKALEDFTKKLANARNGQVYFAHVLLPHEPYAFDANCRLNQHADWQSPEGPGSSEARQSAYAAQVYCTMRMIDTLLDAVDRSPAGEGAIVVLHGDHGSRNVSRRPDIFDQGVPALNYAMTYSTLFAVRAPGIEPGLVSGREPLERLLEALAKSNYREEPVPSNATAQVFLEDRNWIPKKLVDLPPYGSSLTRN